MEGMYRSILTDVERAHWTESWTIDESTLPLGTKHTWRVQKTALKGGTQEGVDLIELDNGALSVFIVPTRGMGIWKGTYRGILPRLGITRARPRQPGLYRTQRPGRPGMAQRL